MLLAGHARVTLAYAAGAMSLADVWDAHTRAEFETRDLEAAMRTMTLEPRVWNVATAIGAVGQQAVRTFYSEQLVGKMPADTTLELVSRTESGNQVVDEFVLRFTHDVEIRFMLPGVPPTGRVVELPHVAVVRFEGEKIVSEHIYWDQASLLAQVGLLDPASVPGVTGAEQAERLRAVSRSHGSP